MEIYDEKGAQQYQNVNHVSVWATINGSLISEFSHKRKKEREKKNILSWKIVAD